MKSLRIFEEKKNKKRKVKTERKLYRSYILSTWIPCKKKKLYNQLFYAHCQTTITPTKNYLNIKG